MYPQSLINRSISIFKFGAIVATAIYLSGCVAAPLLGLAAGGGAVASQASATNADDDTLVQKTATYFGAKPNQIKIKNRQQGTFSSVMSYQTVYKGVLYNCDYMGAGLLTAGQESINCTKPGGQPFN